MSALQEEEQFRDVFDAGGQQQGAMGYSAIYNHNVQVRGVGLLILIYLSLDSIIGLGLSFITVLGCISS